MSERIFVYFETELEKAMQASLEAESCIYEEEDTVKNARIALQRASAALAAAKTAHKAAETHEETLKALLAEAKEARR